MTDYLPAMINLRYPLVLPWHRVEFHARRPGWEAERLEDMRERIEPGMTVWDIGAECGDFTALYRLWVGDDGVVVPIEPQTAMWPDLVGTWLANGLPCPPWTFQGFVGDFTSDGAHYQLRDAEEHNGEWTSWPASAGGEVVPDPGFKHLAHHTDHVETATIDWLAEHMGHVPDVLVLDIEGAECRAMRGAAHVLTEAAGPGRGPLVYVSVHPPTMLDWYGDTEDDLDAVMLGYGYGGTYLGTHGGENFVLFQRGAPSDWLGKGER